MIRNTDYCLLSSKACSAILAIIMLLLLAGLSAAQTQTFCGTKQCRAGRDLSGNYYHSIVKDHSLFQEPALAFLLLPEFLSRILRECHA
jgi:hypothetical protein